MSESRPRSPATLNYTTAVPVLRTVGEVQGILAAAGAARVTVDYDPATREPCAVGFVLRTPHGDRTFRLPVAAEQVRALLAEQERAGRLRIKGRPAKAGTYSTPEQSARVAWRIVKDWLEAQLALIAAHLVTLDQVMLPYLLVDGDRTLYEVYVAREQAALTAGDPE